MLSYFVIDRNTKVFSFCARERIFQRRMIKHIISINLIISYHIMATPRSQLINTVITRIIMNAISNVGVVPILMKCK